MKKPVLLCILDGFGVKNNSEFDAIAQASTPNFDRIFETYPNSKLETFGLAVGLPKGQMGNSEVGHMNIGSGRVILQSLPKIDESFTKGEFKKLNPITNSISKLKENSGAIHIVGLCSNGGVHAHIDHIISAAKTYAQNNIPVKIHAITDGRDVGQKSAIEFISQLVKLKKEFDNISIASISGRYYAMDRDKRWDRVQKAYNAITTGKSENKFSGPIVAIENSYKQDVTDEFIIPEAAENYSGIKDGDAILMANFRADRAREILEAITFENFEGFTRDKKPELSSAIGFVEYSEELNQKLQTLYPAEKLKNTLGEVIANNGLKQLRVAETEKYAHVTFFFNGGAEAVFDGEERILVPSPDVATYDLKPEMSAAEVTENLVNAINSDKFDLIVVNYANGDMVGHTGVFEAAKKAVETLDKSISQLENAILAKNGVMLITADHGNVEEMVDENGNPHTQHTVGYVPFVIVDNDKKYSLKEGRLADIAPTILNIMNIEKPREMNGISLIN